MASGVGVTSRTHAPGSSPVKVSVTSISVLRGNPRVRGRYSALRDGSSWNAPCRAWRSAPTTPYASRSAKSVASTSTRPPCSAATVNPHNTDRANDSSTARRSAAFPVSAR